MKKWYKNVLCCLAFAILIPATSVLIADINITTLTQETQKVSQDPDAITMVWWIPEEFWQASFEQTPDITTAEINEFLEVLRPYTMFAVVDGTVGTYGGVTYKSENWVRSNIRLYDTWGNIHTPETKLSINADTNNLLDMFKPLLANMLGPMGENMHFFLFPASTNDGKLIASTKENGQFKITLDSEEFKWQLPLDALLSSKICSECSRECKGSWKFCPWCGKNLTEKQ